MSDSEQDGELPWSALRALQNPESPSVHEGSESSEHCEAFSPRLTRRSPKHRPAEPDNAAEARVVSICCARNHHPP